jgi:hypothetical protein
MTLSVPGSKEESELDLFNIANLVISRPQMGTGNHKSARFHLERTSGAKLIIWCGYGSAVSTSFSPHEFEFYP